MAFGCNPAYTWPPIYAKNQVYILSQIRSRKPVGYRNFWEYLYAIQENVFYPECGLDTNQNIWTPIVHIITISSSSVIRRTRVCASAVYLRWTQTTVDWNLSGAGIPRALDRNWTIRSPLAYRRVVFDDKTDALIPDISVRNSSLRDPMLRHLMACKWELFSCLSESRYFNQFLLFISCVKS